MIKLQITIHSIQCLMHMINIFHRNSNRVKINAYEMNGFCMMCVYIRE